MKMLIRRLITKFKERYNSEKEKGETMIEALMEAELKAYKNFIKKFKAKDDYIEALYEKGIDTLNEKDELEFEELKEEYREFKAFFKKYDGNYWGTMSVLDVVEKIEEDAGFVAA